MMIPNVVGMSEDIRSVCRKFDTRVVFKSGWTLCSTLTDTLSIGSMWYNIIPLPAAARFTLGTPKETRLRNTEMPVIEG